VHRIIRILSERQPKPAKLLLQEAQILGHDVSELLELLAECAPSHREVAGDGLLYLSRQSRSVAKAKAEFRWKLFAPAPFFPAAAVGPVPGEDAPGKAEVAALVAVDFRL